MQRVTRAFLLLLAVTFITGGCSTESTVDGTEENPYQIYTFADLLLMLEEENLRMHFLQMNDIDAPIQRR